MSSRRIPVRALLALAILLSVALPATADDIARWNRTALETMSLDGRLPEYRVRALAAMHVAMFEALNFVIGRYRSIRTVVPPSPLAMSRPAVACAAAHAILLEFYPEQRAFLDGHLKQALEGLPEGSEKAAAVEEGRAIARNIYAALSNESKVPHAMQFDVARWSDVVSRAATLNDLDLLDNARFYAVGAAAIRDSYFANATKSDGRCGACVTSAALSAVLSAQFGRPYLDLLGPEPVLNGDAEGGRLGARLGADIARVALARQQGRQTSSQAPQPPVIR